MSFSDLTDKKVGKLKVIKQAEKRMVGNRMRRFWTVRCDCGTYFDKQHEAITRL